mgnify:CR=1 FL=1|jgi:hypothetical protein
MRNPPPPSIYYSRTCIYCDDIGVCDKKPRVGLFRQECVVPCKIGKREILIPKPPPPPPSRIINEDCYGETCPKCGSSMKLLWKRQCINPNCKFKPGG